MKLLSLYLKNFRNYHEACIEFSPQVNYLYGENAAGKTSLLEAIYFLITGRSFRTSRLTDLIHFEAHAAYLEAHFEKNGVEQHLKLTLDREGRKIWHNETAISSLSALLGILAGVVISPEDYTLVKGGPLARRQFLDLQIAQTSPPYLHHLSRYMRAMKQRNELLRRGEIHLLSVWEAPMAESAAFLIAGRHQTLLELQEQPSIVNHVDNLTLRYRTSTPSVDGAQSYLLEQYEKNREKEIERGSTLVGPHRDDIEILVNGKEARFFASEGQTRGCITALRLAQWARMQGVINEPPILCIDDVGVSLDALREEHLFCQLEGPGQVFLTSPKPTEFSSYHTLKVESGAVVV